MSDPAILKRFRRVLVLCPHTDDEFGCAGTIARMIEDGADVRYVALSRCEESVPPGFAPDTLEHECRACATCLGIPAEQVDVFDFRVRHFPGRRQDILELFVQLRRDYAPDLVLLPSSFDTHQDHKTVFDEGFRAFKHTTILGYELPQNLISFDNSAFIKLSEAHLEKKIDALGRYESQMIRPYAAADFIRSLAKVRGVQCNATYAEAFELIRLVID
jgi:LmbE family N-acetylglucosaminyl deacetylase